LVAKRALLRVNDHPDLGPEWSLTYLPVIGQQIRQHDEFKRYQKELKALRSEMDRLTAAKANLDFQDFSDFCRRHGIPIED